MTSRDFSSAYEEHVWHVYGFFAYRVGSRADAEDLTQLTFERALKAWGRYDARRASMGTWLLAIARNLLIDHHRAGRGGRERPLDDEGLEGDPRLAREDTPDLGLSPEVEQALAGLGEREREIIALRFGGDRNSAQIAKIMGLSTSNVQQITSRTLRRMRTELERPGASGSERADSDRAGGGG